jgi:hypothetical protein
MKQEKIKTTIWGVVIGAILTIFVGFSWGGWVLGSTSSSLGEDMARIAVIERLAPMCLEQFKQDPEKSSKLKEFKEISSWDQNSFIQKNGWAIMPFEKEHDRAIAERCSELIIEVN